MSMMFSIFSRIVWLAWRRRYDQSWESLRGFERGMMMRLEVVVIKQRMSQNGASLAAFYFCSLIDSHRRIVGLSGIATRRHEILRMIW